MEGLETSATGGIEVFAQNPEMGTAVSKKLIKQVWFNVQNTDHSRSQDLKIPFLKL